MHVTKLFPLVLTEVGQLRQPAVLAPNFDNAAAPVQPCIIMALLGDVPIGPQPESTMHLYIVNILSVMHKGKHTKVALRTSAA